MRDMEKLQKSYVLKVKELSRRKLTEDQDTIMELRAKIQELQNEVNCKDAESVRSGPSHVPSQPALLPPCRDPGGLLSRNNQQLDIWSSQVYRETFLQIHERLLRNLIQEDSILGFLT